MTEFLKSTFCFDAAVPDPTKTFTSCRSATIQVKHVASVNKNIKNVGSFSERFVSRVDAKMHLRFGSEAVDPASVRGDVTGKRRRRRETRREEKLKKKKKGGLGLLHINVNAERGSNWNTKNPTVRLIKQKHER